ncbi:MAG TPA: Amuc_1100 family pilus-like protein [Verrucomicrobiae bacterium]|jgi:hypothetical protein|nr:Amuc_1100 family pilus-like protein [Verrucomicrobiae bacterium]
MAWIKRNLFFFIGSILALGLIGVGGWYFYSEYTAEGQSGNQIAADYDKLRELNQQNPHPGKKGGPVDNVQAAQDQQAALHAWIDSTRPYFKPVEQPGNLNNFPSELDSSVAQLQREARQDGVSLPPSYYFTFLAQKSMLAIPRTTLPQLAARLAEIKVICHILFDAKINALESVRREVISDDDTNGPDYLPPDQRTVSTPLAEMTPYEVTFECFSGELASVLGNFAASPYGLVVKSIVVEPAQAAGPMAAAAPGPGYYGSPGGTPYGAGHGNPYMYNPAYSGYPGASPPQRSTTPTPPPPNGRPVKFLSENKLRITLLVEVVKPKPGR